MKLNYHPETGSLYIDLAERPGVDSREVSEGIVPDYDAAGTLVRIDIDNASRKVELGLSCWPACRARSSAAPADMALLPPGSDYSYILSDRASGVPPVGWHSGFDSRDRKWVSPPRGRVQIPGGHIVLAP